MCAVGTVAPELPPAQCVYSRNCGSSYLQPNVCTVGIVAPELPPAANVCTVGTVAPELPPAQMCTVGTVAPEYSVDGPYVCSYCNNEPHTTLPEKPTICRQLVFLLYF